MNYCRSTAFHEAGHVVASMRLRHGFHTAHVLPRGQTRMIDRHGREVLCRGLVQGYAFNWDVRGIPRAASGVPAELIESLGHACMSVDLAGPFAEARYSHVSAGAILLSGGMGDWHSASRIARWLWPDDDDRRSAALNAAEREARALVRKLWEAITCVAGILIRDGFLAFEDVPFSLLDGNANGAPRLSAGAGG